MFKSKKMLLIWTIILSWSVMTVGMDGGKAAPGGRTRGIPKRDYPDDVVVEPDIAEEVPVLDATDIAAIGAALEKERKRNRDRAYKVANKAKIQAAQKAYYEANADKIKAYEAARRKQKAAVNAAYHAARREEINARKRARRAQQKAEKEAQAALAGAGAPKIADV